MNQIDDYPQFKTFGKNIFTKCFCGLIVLLILIFFTLLLYIKVWESAQDVFFLENVTIKRISPYYASGGELHWSTWGYRIHVYEDSRIIDYPARKWNGDTIIGKKATLEVRRSFFNNELDGISIKLKD